MKKRMVLLFLCLACAGSILYAENDLEQNKRANLRVEDNYYKPYDRNAYYPGQATSTFSNYSSWMNFIEDNQKIMTMSIPGTHDTMAFKIQHSGLGILEHAREKGFTQSLTLDQQLHVGVRYVDMRVKLHSDHFRMYHGELYLDNKFDDALNVIKKFLEKNPSEFILMRLTDEQGIKDDLGRYTFLNKLQERYYNSKEYGNLFYKQNTNANTTLANVRGKIVLLKDFNDTPINLNGTSIKYDFKGLYLRNQIVQDDYEVSNLDSSLYEKYKKIVAHFDKSNKAGTGAKLFYLNHLSATGSGALDSYYPWAVASGFSGKSNFSYRTFSNSNPSKYPDWPSKEGKTGIAGMNIMANDYLKANNTKFSGVVIMDFPGPEIIRTIAERNIYKKKQKVTYLKSEGVTNIPIDNTNYDRRTSIQISSTIPLKEGHTFQGWKYIGNSYVHKDKIFKPGQSLIIFESPSFEMQWKKNTYTLKYKTNTGESNIDPKTYSIPFNDSTLLSNLIPIKEGYIFKGWKFNDEIYFPSQYFVMPGTNVEFVAVWEEEEKNQIPLKDKAEVSNGIWIYIGD